jgi:hypothetical protein
MNFTTRPLALTCVAITTVTLAACGGSHHAKKTTPPPSSSSPIPTPTTPVALPAINPLTGLKPSSNPVVAVKIDDTGNGRPQRNINLADIVYIEQVEGGLTRLLAVYDTSLPVVEAVRSTRASDPELVAQYGPIAYVASGGAGNPLAILDHSKLKTAINDRGAAGFARDGNRGAPYNLTANLAAIGKRLKGPQAKSVGFLWAAASLGKDPIAHTVRTTVGSTAVRFDYNAALKRYVRVIDGAVQHTASGAVISTPNVIVQFCKVTVYPADTDVNGNPSKYTHSIGSGTVVVFRNGRRINGTWSRPNATSGTTFKDATGAPIPLAFGGAWVVLVATGVGLVS